MKADARFVYFPRDSNHVVVANADAIRLTLTN